MPSYSGDTQPTGAAPASNQVSSASGGPFSPDLLPGTGTSDVYIRGGLTINPAYAADFYAGRYFIERPIPGDTEAPNPPSKIVSQEQATIQSPNAWKKQTAPAMSNAVLFGDAMPQAPLLSGGPKGGAAVRVGYNGASPAANRKFIPPLAMFNDASQWVNRLLFHKPMTWFDADTSNPPLKAQYYSPPPINTNNLAAGTLNLQMQLGRMAIQAQQLTISASNYFG